MNYWERTFLMHRIDENINRKATGTADEFAPKMKISRRNLFDKFNELRDLGGDIQYCNHRRTYYYKDDKRPTLPALPKYDTEKIRGGESIFTFFAGVQNFCTPADDLCNRLTNNEKQNGAHGFRFWWFGD